jgi:histidine phosphotransfer protein HptB
MTEKIVIDEELLEGLRDIMEDEFDDLIDSFKTEAESLLVEIGGAIDSGNHDVLFTSSHSLKSSSGNIGAIALAETARQLESIGRNESTDGADSLYSQACHEFSDVKENLAANCGA